MTLEKVKAAIELCENKGNNQKEALAYLSEKAGKLGSWQAQKLFWQQASMGVLNDNASINKTASENQVIASCIKHESVISYFAYGNARGRIDAHCGFLDSNSAFYQEMLSSSVINFLQKQRGTEEAKRICILFTSGSDIAEIARVSLDIHERAINNSASHRLADNAEFKQDNNNILAALNANKAILHEFLMKHFTILHQEQLGVNGLSKIHSSSLSNDLTKIIKDYELHHQGQARSMSDDDRQQIVAIAHLAINSKEWWEKLTTKQVKAKFALVHNRQQEVNMTLKLQQEKLNDIKSFEPKFSVENLRAELIAIPSEQLRDQHIDKIWTSVFKKHIALPLNQFDQLRKEAKTIDEHLAIINEQQEFGAKTAATHYKLVNHGARECQDNRINDLLTIERVSPNFIETFARDIRHGTDIGLWSHSEFLKQLQQTKYEDLYSLIAGTENDCRKYHIRAIEQDLDRITDLGKVKKDNMEFTTHKAYLEHHVNNPKLKTYLQDTHLSQKLDDIYKHEAQQAHQMELNAQVQKQQKLQRPQQKEFEKEHDKGGFSL